MCGLKPCPGVSACRPVLVAAVAAVGLLAGARPPASASTQTDPGSATAAGQVTTASPAPATPTQPIIATDSPIKNIVFVLADDLDTATFEQVPRLRALHSQGLTLRNMVVTESLCCPSRTSILRSQYVHNHRVVSNQLTSNGGWATFAQRDEEADCLPVWLHAAGVQTAYVGKYLNGYGEDGDPTAIPAGWYRWFVPTTKSGKYRGYGYTVNTDGRLVSYAARKDDFLPDVITDQAVYFIRTARAPFYVQINSTSPHDPAHVAARHRNRHDSARIPRTSSFNARGGAAPDWRKRVRSTESVADTVEAVMRALRAAGTLESTLIVVSSDNGFHAVSRRLPPGKRTPYHEDTIVPAVLIGPAIAPGTHTDAVTSTIDLGPTFADILGATVPEWADGRSLAPLLAGGADVPWRTGVLSESMGVTAFNDPDFQAFKPPKYLALRTQRWLYIEYDDGSRELFDRRASRAEVDNALPTMPPEVVADLSAHLKELAACSGASCRVADTWVESPPAP